MEPVLTAELAREIESSIVRATESRLNGIAALPGNPLGIEFGQWGAVRATMVRGTLAYYPYFNAVRGVGPSDAEAFDAAVQWFESSRLGCAVPLSPMEADEALLQHLSSKGLRPRRFMNVLYSMSAPAGIQTASHASTNVTVVEDVGHKREDFIALLMDGTAAGDLEMRRRVSVAEFKDWRCYVAFVKGQPAAIGALFVEDGIALLASAWTRPQLRGLGCQTELLKRRIADAARLGCRLLIAKLFPVLRVSGTWSGWGCESLTRSLFGRMSRNSVPAPTLYSVATPSTYVTYFIPSAFTHLIGEPRAV